MLPYLAQGANSALEDGAVLGRLLGHIQRRDQIPHAIQLYQDVRKGRGEAIARETFKQVGLQGKAPTSAEQNLSEGSITKNFDAEGSFPYARRPLADAARRDLSRSAGLETDCELAEPLVSRLQFESKVALDLDVLFFFIHRTCPTVQPWLFGYDAIAEADRAWTENEGTIR